MDHSSQVLWAKYLIKAAIDYFNDRTVGACLLIDNAVLGDTVLATFQGGTYGDFVVCVSPGFTTYLDFRDLEMTIAIQVEGADHVMSVPYHAIRAVVANTGTVDVRTMTERGQINVIAIPPVVYPPGSQFRQSPDQVESSDAHTQLVSEPLIASRS
jgi:stringent starvation protein B